MAKKKKEAKEKVYIAQTGGSYENKRIEAGNEYKEADIPPKHFKAFIEMGTLVEKED